jgi:Tfp pilus assembly protein PilP
MRRLLLPFLLIAACSKGSQADLQYISQARSLAAEWALVNEQAQQGHLTSSYVHTMHKDLRQQLQSTAASLTEPQSAYGQEIQAVLREPDDAGPLELRTHASKLKQIEDNIESA